jgi:hypothetical protein
MAVVIIGGKVLGTPFSIFCGKRRSTDSVAPLSSIRL